MSLPVKPSKERSGEKQPKITPRPTATSLARASLSPGLKSSSLTVRSRSTTSPQAAPKTLGSSTTKTQVSLAETRRAPSAPECGPQRKSQMTSLLPPPDDEYHRDDASIKETDLKEVKKEPDVAEELMKLHSPGVQTPNNLRISDDSEVQDSMATIHSENSGETITPPQAGDILATHKEILEQLKEELDHKHQRIQEVYSSPNELDSTEIEVKETDKESEQLTPVRTYWSGDLGANANQCSNHIQFEESTLTTLRFRLNEATACMADVCQQALSNRETVLDWILDTLDHEDVDAESILSTSQYEQKEPDTEKLKKLQMFKKEGSSLLEMLDEMKIKAEKDIDAALELSKQASSERDAQFALGVTLTHDVGRLRSRIEDLEKQLDEAVKQPTLPPPIPGTEQFELQKLSRELMEERETSSSLKERLSNVESQLRTAKARINKQDRQLKESDSSLAALTNTVKSTEDQTRQREVQFDMRARKARDALKTSELTVHQLTQQKEALEHRITELTEKMRVSSERYSGNSAGLRTEIASLAEKLEAQCLSAQREAELRSMAEEALTAASANIHKLQADIAQLTQRLPSPDAPTEREIAACAEAQAAHEAVRLLEEELEAARREKKHFLETLANITDSGTEVNLQQKLAAELLSKEKFVENLQDQVRDSTRSCKLNEHKLEQYHIHLSDLLLYRVATAAASGSNSGHQAEEIDYRDPQEEIINLRVSLVEMVHRNEDVMEQLREKETALELQERTARAQKNVIVVREELINMLQQKETEQSEELSTMRADLEQRMRVVDEVNKQIATKALEIQQLFSSVESKQQEIQQREKIIRALEEQLRRAQAQRTRLEEKIAALEHELAESGARRRNEKKFIFF